MMQSSIWMAGVSLAALGCSGALAPSVGSSSPAPNSRVEEAAPTPERTGAEPSPEPASTAGLEMARPVRSVTASPATGASKPSSDDEPPVALAPQTDTDSPPSGPDASQWADVAVLLEQPHRPGQRPRVEGRIQAAGNDEKLAVWNLGGSADPTHISNKSGFHPGVRVVVDTKLLSGSLPKRAPRGQRRSVFSQHALLAHARKWGYWNFRICLEEALRRQGSRKQQTDHGQTIIRVAINSSGKVRAARLVKSELDDKQAQQCLVDRTLDYKPFSPMPRKRLQVELSIKLWPGDAPVPLLEADDDERGPGDVDLDQVHAAVEKRLDRLKRCYFFGLERDEKLWGRLQVQLTLREKGGSPTRIRETESQFPDRRVTRCVRRELRKLDLPPTQKGAVVVVQGIRFGAPPAKD